MTKEVYQILSARGYPLTCRGTIEVKGKGNMETYFLDGYRKKTYSPETNIISNPMNSIDFPNSNSHSNSFNSIVGTSFNDKSSGNTLGTISEKGN